MTTAREKLVRQGQPGAYHCISRVVRRAYLLGEDPFTGKNYDHRKEWVRNRLIHISRCFAIDVCGYAVMINHTHVQISVRPDIAATWSDRDVAERWLSLFPGPLKHAADSEKVREMVIEMIINEPERIETLRDRLSSVSWFMRCLNEYLARKANREDECTGRFWEGRFKSVALLDTSAEVACLTYIDLNPVRAGLAETPEQSDYTSAQDRIIARQAQKKLDGLEAELESSRDPTPEQVDLTQAAKRDLQRDAWLSPIPNSSQERDDSFIRMTLDEYLELLDWTGRQVKKGKPGQIPPHLAHILERLEIEAACWMETVCEFDGLFHRVAGRVRSIVSATQRVGQNWLRGKPNAGKVFG